MSKLLTVAAVLLAATPCATTIRAMGQIGPLPEVVTGGADRTIRVFGADGKQLQSISAHDSPLNCIALSADGRHILTGSNDPSVKVWGAETGIMENSFDAHESGVMSLALSPEGRILTTGGADHYVKLWNPITGKNLKTIQAHNQSVRCLVWSSDGRFFASGSPDRLVRVWRADGSLAGTIVTQDDAITALAWTPDGRFLVSGSADGNLRVWNSADLGVFARTRAHEKAITAIAVSRDGVVATAGQDSRLRLWSIGNKSLVEVRTLSGDKVVSCAGWSQDGRLLVTGGPDKMLRYRSVKDLATVFEAKGSDGAITCLAVGPG